MLKTITDNEKKIIFAAGAAVAIAVTKVFKAKRTRDLTVKTLARGIIMKDNLMEEVANIREEADDICNEARMEAKAKSDNENVVDAE